MTPFVFILFGATGDLARNKLMPALFSLYKKKMLGEEFFIIGFARRPYSDQEYAHMLGDELEFHKEAQWADFAKNVYYQQGLFDEMQGYEKLIDRLNTFDQKIGACITRLFYLATPPNNYENILQNMQDAKLPEGCGQGSNKWTRVCIEKPFGKDLETARNLDRKLAEIFEERQIFRVDHYLAKETVQNMIAFRFANSIFEPVWNKEYIDHVQITFAEKKGVSDRGMFFDGVGVLRDVAQNHLLQLLATVAMEQPASVAKENVREARANAIKAITFPEGRSISEVTVRGQYNGYREEHDIDPKSNTETFIAMKLMVATPRFDGVPFYLRAGKALDKNMVDIKIIFKQTCHILFKEYGCPEVGNVLTINIQPDEGIRLRVIAKQPGEKNVLGTVEMRFSYAEEFSQKGLDAYERLLLDILSGDQMLFNRSDELESSWQLISNILTGWGKEKTILPLYEPGTFGPKNAFDLIEKDGRRWQ